MMGMNVDIKRKTCNRLLLLHTLHQKRSPTLLLQLVKSKGGIASAVVPSALIGLVFSALSPGNFKTTLGTKKSIKVSPSLFLSSSSLRVKSCLSGVTGVPNACSDIESESLKKTEERRDAGNILLLLRSTTDFGTYFVPSSCRHYQRGYISDHYQPVTFRCVARSLTVGTVWVNTYSNTTFSSSLASSAPFRTTKTTCPIRTLFTSTTYTNHNKNMSHVGGAQPDIDGNIQDMRKPYRHDSDIFDIKDLVSRDPIVQFGSWFQEACKEPGITEPNAIALATASRSGQPSVRMVLLKGFGKEGFKIFTNFYSRKGKELLENPLCSMCIHWEPLNRSVRIDGKVHRLSEEESTYYFNSRPRSSQMGAAVSNQSTVIPNREYLMDKFAELEAKYKNDEVIPKPDFWGGYLIKPDVIEFWQGQTTRIHDRLRFRKKETNEVLDTELTHEGEDGWVIERLSP